MRYITSLILVVLLGLSANLLAQSKMDSLLLEGNYVEALTIANQCIQEDSTNLKCLEAAGISAFRLGNFLIAKQSFLTALTFQKDNQKILKLLANVYELEENIPKSVKYYNKLLKLDSTNSIFFRKLGQLYMKADMYHDAFPYFAEAYKINANDFFTVKGMVELLTSNKQYTLADSILTEALLIDSTNIQFVLMSARSKYIQKEYQSTVDRIESIRGKIDLSNYYNKMVGFSYLQIDSLDKAIWHLSKSLVDEPRPEHANYYLGIAYDKKNEKELALEYYAQAIDAGTSQDLDLYHHSMAKIHKERNELKQAVHHYTEATKNSDDPLLFFLLAQVCDEYYKDKNIAIRYYKKYENSNHENTAYKQFAKERRLYLKEIAHQMKK